MKKLARNASRSTIGKFIDNVRVGWSYYSFLFYIGGVSAILGGIFGLAGWFSAALTVAFFYYAGEFRRHLSVEGKRY